jgi:hypothetical protein
MEENMLTYEKIKNKVLFENSEPRFKDMASKCVVIENLDNIVFKILVYVLLNEYFECFYKAHKEIYFLMKIGKGRSMLYTYAELEKLCVS